MSFKIGDRVVFKKGLLTREWYRKQASGVGVIIGLSRRAFLDVRVRWANSCIESYASQDLIHYEEIPMNRSIPTKEQVLEAAASCLSAKDTLKILFPQDFEKEFDWEDFQNNPFKYLKGAGVGQIKPSKELLEAYRKIGHPIPCLLYSFTSLKMLKRLINYLAAYAGKGGE